MTPESDDKSNRTAEDTVFSAKKAISSFPGEVGDGRPRTATQRRRASSLLSFSLARCPSAAAFPFSFPFLLLLPLLLFGVVRKVQQ